MAVLETLAGLISRIPLTRFFPTTAVGVEGQAEFCTDDHIPIFVSGAPPRPPSPLHIDVHLKLWNKSASPLTVFEIRKASVRKRPLKPDAPGYLGSFQEATLEVGGRRAEEDCRLHPPDGETLTANPGDQVRLEIGLSRGRHLIVKLRIRTPS